MVWIKNKPLSIGLKTQLALTIVAVVAGGFFNGSYSAVSAMLGGGVSLLSSAAFAMIVSQHVGYTAHMAIKTAVKAEIVKVSMIVLLLWVVFKNFENIDALAFIATFILTILAHGVVLFVTDHTKIN